MGALMTDAPTIKFTARKGITRRKWNDKKCAVRER